LSEDTRTRILDAAERLFAADGIDATSLRAITREAGANLAAVNYHFGSKDALVGEVYGRRLTPVNEARLEGLERILGAAGEGAPSLEGIIAAFVAPALAALGDSEQGPNLARLMGRAHTEVSEEVRRVVFAQFIEVVTAFTSAFERALPGLTVDEIQLRFKLMIGTLAYSMVNPPRFGGGIGVGEVEEMVQELVTFCAAGFRAGMSESPA
jgi:AcrR family transcriptional regulator